MKQTFLWLVIVCLVGLSACTSSPATQSVEPEQADAPEEPTSAPTDTPEPEPTATEAPTPTEEPTPTATPEGRLFRDDFTSELADGWRWGNENPDNWNISDDGWLVIVGEDEFALENEFPIKNLLLRDLPAGDVSITAHLEADPDTDFQQAALWLWENGETYLVLNHGFCGPCGGAGIYFDHIVPGIAPNSYQLPGVTESDLYLRIEIRSEQVSLYYALEPDQWERVGRFGNFFEFKQVGIGVTNIDPFGADDDLTARFDWFEIEELTVE